MFYTLQLASLGIPPESHGYGFESALLNVWIKFSSVARGFRFEVYSSSRDDRWTRDETHDQSPIHPVLQGLNHRCGSTKRMDKKHSIGGEASGDYYTWKNKSLCTVQGTRTLVYIHRPIRRKGNEDKINRKIRWSLTKPVHRDPEVIPPSRSVITSSCMEFLQVATLDRRATPYFRG